MTTLCESLFSKREQYLREGYGSLTVNEMAASLGISPSGVSHYIRSKGITKGKRRTELEKQALREKYRDFNDEAAAERDQYIEEAYGPFSMTEMAAHLGISISAVSRYIKAKGFTKKDRLTDLQKQILQEKFRHLGLQESAALIDKPVSVTLKAARTMGLTKRDIMPPAKRQYLQENHKMMSVQDIAKNLDVSTSTLLRVKKEMNLLRRHIWTDEERKFVADNRKLIKITKIAKHLGISVPTVRCEVARQKKLQAQAIPLLNPPAPSPL